jgi:hypothetical protein
LDLLTRVLTAVGSAVAGAAGDRVLAAAAVVYGRAAGTVGDAFAQESRLLGGKIRAAGLAYQVTDETAVQVRSEDVAADQRGRAR